MGKSKGKDSYGKDYHKRWYAANKHRIVHNYHKNMHDPQWRYERLVKARNRRVELRDQILEILGRKCAVCGFSDERALQVDHIYSDGNIYRKKGGSHDQYLKQLKSIKNNEGKLQLLCANCNWIKRVEKKESQHPKWNGPYFPDGFSRTVSDIKKREFVVN